MNTFHIEPMEWQDLFDYLEFTGKEIEIAKYIKSLERNKLDGN